MRYSPSSRVEAHHMNQMGFMRDSSTLSKIPYGGFSPVRLQTGSPRRPSDGKAVLIRRASVALGPYSHYWQLSGSSDTTRSRPEALGSPTGSVVPSDHGLLWPHPSHSLRDAPTNTSGSPLLSILVSSR